MGKISADKKKCTANIRAELPCEIEQVWETVTNLREYSWRSDLDRVEMLMENQFVEYDKNGIATTFTVTSVKAYERWEFDMENSSITGHWTGIFQSRGDETVIDFTEEVTVKKMFMKPFAGKFLQKQQLRYVADLKRRLGLR